VKCDNALKRFTFHFSHLGKSDTAMDIKSKNLNLPITIISIVIPVVVAILFYLPRPNIEAGFNVHILPLFHAVLNSATAVLLLGSLFFIRRGQVKAHKVTNLIAVALSLVFLVSYVTYHFLAKSTKYGDLNHDYIVDATEKAALGGTSVVYYFILLTHIVLAAIIVPLVLFTLLRGFQSDFVRHKKIARYTWPIWFYVAVTGVIVYVMISPYY
jgi:putative membrane protein